MQNGPASLDEQDVLCAVTGHVGGELGPPPIAVVLRQYTVIRTAVPEASVDEHRQPCGQERDVRPTRQICPMNAVPQPAAMQDPADPPFGSGVASRHPTHLRR